MQRLRRFARYWTGGKQRQFFAGDTVAVPDPCVRLHRFHARSDWLYARIGRQHSIALDRLAQLLFEYLTQECEQAAVTVAETLWHDWQRPAAAKTRLSRCLYRQCGSSSARGKSEAQTQARHLV